MSSIGQMFGAKLGHAHDKSNVQLPGWLQPYATQFLDQYSQLAMPGGKPAGLPDAALQQVAGFDPAQTQAINDIIAQGQQVQPTETQLTQDTLSGKYLDPATNPYLQKTYDEAARAVTDQYGQSTAPQLQMEASLAGAQGGTGYAEQAATDRYGLGQNLASLANQIYGGNYEAERGRQMQQQQLLPQMFAPEQAALGAGGLRQQQAQQVMDVGSQNAYRQFQTPYDTMNMFGSSLGMARGPAQFTDQYSYNKQGAK